MIKNGFIYPTFNFIVQLLCYLNLVELFKFIAKKITVAKFKGVSQDELKTHVISNSNIAIDIYQIFKWSVLVILWVFAVSSIYAEFVIFYLIATNLFTYFYYHVWGSKFNQRVDRDTLNRKFLNSLLAISYYIACYAYLYQIQYHSMVTWPNDLVDFKNSIYLSVANAFTLTYGGFMPTTQNMRMVFMSELINTFLFFTVIITNSIPNHAGKDDK